MDIYEYAWYVLMGLAVLVIIVRRTRSRPDSEPASDTR